MWARWGCAQVCNCLIITQSNHISINEWILMVFCFSLIWWIAGMIVTSFLWGFIVDAYGRQKIMVYGFLCTAACTIASSFSQYSWQLILFKFVDGIVYVLKRKTIQNFQRMINFLFFNFFSVYPVRTRPYSRTWLRYTENKCDLRSTCGWVFCSRLETYHSPVSAHSTRSSKPDKLLLD